MSTEVREIIERIKHLSEGDREALRAELAREDEREWQRLAAPARQAAQQRGIDDDEIARTIESMRYGDKAPRP